MKKLIVLASVIMLALTSLAIHRHSKDVHAQTAPYACPVGQFVNQQLVNTGQSCASLPSSTIMVNSVSCSLGGSCTIPISSAIQSQDFSLAPGLFATNTATGGVYFETNAVTIKAVVSREQGSPVCTAAPVLVLLDLGTSASTAYGSATVLYSQTLSTSNTVAANTGLNVAVAAGHYLGVGFSAGTCVTPPTISTTVMLQ